MLLTAKRFSSLVSSNLLSITHVDQNNNTTIRKLRVKMLLLEFNLETIPGSMKINGLMEILLLPAGYFAFQPDKKTLRDHQFLSSLPAFESKWPFMLLKDESHFIKPLTMSQTFSL